ncbi:16S rRNA (guanine(527)-N(7))-methyltransferase RsmG, partial [Candidatus Poribacteria bacterium]|nr:16S rRNA (guanine(527)-N(7))-methyltransferase RsmG [Candidatus Poribacteria bacterium]
MEEQFRQLLEEEFSRYGFPLDTKQIEQLTIYRTELQRWNTHTNLTAITEDTEIIHRHFLDSVSVLNHCNIRTGDSVVDIGTGAGFPGIVLKIYIPDIRLTLI